MPEGCVGGGVAPHSAGVCAQAGARGPGHMAPGLLTHTLGRTGDSEQPGWLGGAGAIGQPPPSTRGRGQCGPILRIFKCIFQSLGFNTSSLSFTCWES